MADPTVSTLDAHPLALDGIDPSATGTLTETRATERLRELQAELRELHDLMMAAETHSLLLILEGMDASGKDVTIENVHGAFNPQAARVKAFKARTGEETKHHFLWRADLATPMIGEVVTFDRSYYEQAMPPDLEGDVDGERLDRRLAHINAFEALLIDEGTIVVKVFLHVNKGVQHQRLEERQQDIAAAWKISGDDWTKREKWDRYMTAFERFINTCATSEAPWYVVPADHRWYHNLAIAQILVDRLSTYRAEWEDARRRTGEEKQREAAAARQQG